MADMALIRAGIVANLAPITETGTPGGITVGDGVKPVQVLAYHTDDPVPPTVMVEAIDEIEYLGGFGAPGRSGDLRIVVQAVTGTVTEQSAQEWLDAMLLGATALKKLIETKGADEEQVTFGGSVSSAFVASCSGHKLIPFPGKRVLGAEWTVLATLTD